MLIPLLFILLAAPSARAACLKKNTPSLEVLRICQEKLRSARVAAAVRKGKPLTPDQLEDLDESQRAEAREFLARPGVVVEGPPPAAAKPADKLGGATLPDLARVGPKAGGDVAGLQARLHAAAGDGSAGITPAMAADIRASLTKSQGGLSPEMASLLDSVERDGAKLTPETMKKLQGAGRAAKGEGLDLNIDPGMEKELLNRDFDADKAPFEKGSQSAPSVQ